MNKIILNPFEEIVAGLEAISGRLDLIEQSLSSRPETEADGYLTIDDISELTGLTKQTIYGQRSKRLIPAYKFGRELRFKKSEIMAWMESRKQPVFNVTAEVV
jgi:excisionase family DNA binding protein